MSDYSTPNMKNSSLRRYALALFMAAMLAALPSTRAPAADTTQVMHRTVEIDGQTIFYREAGPADAPTILLLHGFPTSSHMFRNLIPHWRTSITWWRRTTQATATVRCRRSMSLTTRSTTSVQIIDKFTVKLGLDRYSLYLMDYGAPIGFRLAAKHPERVDSLIIQNGNAYDEGLDNDFWEPIKEYWKRSQRRRTRASTTPCGRTSRRLTNPNMANEDALRFLVTLARPSGNTSTAFATRERSAPTTGTSRNVCSIGLATRRFNSNCSTTTAAILRFTRAGRHISAATSPGR